MNRFACLLFALGFAAAPAHADAPGVPPLPKPARPSVEGYLSADPTCLEWSNGCQTCQKQDGAGALACSTPGIACTPGKIVCQRRK